MLIALESFTFQESQIQRASIVTKNVYNQHAFCKLCLIHFLEQEQLLILEWNCSKKA